jgi:hypothetical protein
MGLNDQCKDPKIQAKISQDCAQLIDDQVAEKKGLGGLAIKTAYGVLKGIGPGYFPRVIQNLLPKAMIAMDSIWQEGLQAGDPVAFLSQNKSRTAEILLGVTDDKIANAKNKIVIGTYNKLRKSIKGDVEEAVPGLAKIISQYA